MNKNFLQIFHARLVTLKKYYQYYLTHHHKNFPRLSKKAKDRMIILKNSQKIYALVPCFLNWV